MALISNETTVSKFFTLHLYLLEVQKGLQISANPSRVEIKEEDLTIEKINLFEREIVYLPKSQRAQLPQRLLDVPGLKDFLNACSLMVRQEHLPMEVTKAEKRAHKFSEKEALRLLESAAQAGFGFAQYVLGVFHNPLVTGNRNGDHNLSWRYGELATKNGVIAAYNILGFLYQFQNKAEEMASNFKKAAEGGNIRGITNIANCYHLGEGVAKDDALAAHWYKKGAERGSLISQYRFGDMCFKGVGVEKNLPLAVDLLKKAVEHGLSDARFSLSLAQAELKNLQLQQAQKTSEQKAQRLKLEDGFKAKYDGFMQMINEKLPQYEELKGQWFIVKGKELQVKSFIRIQELQTVVAAGGKITPQILKEIDVLSKSFTNALEDVKNSIIKAQKKADRKAHQEARRASQKFEIAPVIVESLIEDPAVSETRLIKERLVQEAEAKEKRKSVTLERRLSRTISRSSLKLDFQQTQEQLAKEKERHEQRKSQRLSKLYTKEELIAAGILPAEDSLDPVKTHGRIASFEKTTQEIFEGQREAGKYTQLVRDLLKEFAHSEDLVKFKKAHDYEPLRKGLGNLVGVDHLKPWESKGFRICSFRIVDAIPERVVFAWDKKEKKAYQVTFVNYHPK